MSDISLAEGMEHPAPLKLLLTQSQIHSWTMATSGRSWISISLIPGVDQLLACQPAMVGIPVPCPCFSDMQLSVCFAPPFPVLVP